MVKTKELAGGAKPRIRERKTRRKLGAKQYRNYSSEMLELACQVVASKQISSRDAERQFGIPRRTILNKVNQCHMKPMGRPTILSQEEEEKIVKALIASADFGSPLSKIDLQLIVNDYLVKNSNDVFDGKLPGRDWVQNFLRRHADKLCTRVTQNITRSRAAKSSEEIASYCSNLRQTVKDIPPENIINLDETNLSDDPGASKCIFRRGVRYPERVVNSSKGNISLMFTVTANGECLPIYVVYKADHLYSEWVTGGPPNTRYNRSRSGWFERQIFEEYFETVIVPWAKTVKGAKAVICDNLSSHLSIKIIEQCEAYDIKFVFLPPRSTHITQPLDVAFFGPLKKVWRKILYRYKIKNPSQICLNKKHFPKLLKELIEEIDLNKSSNIKSGFRATGIVPLNPREILKRIPDHQEEVMSYGIDDAFMNYLKEIKTAKPMTVQRNRKIQCEPGKSVTIDDLKIQQKQTVRKEDKIPTTKKKPPGKIFPLDCGQKLEKTDSIDSILLNDIDTNIEKFWLEDDYNKYLISTNSDSDSDATIVLDDLNKILVSEPVAGPSGLCKFKENHSNSDASDEEVAAPVVPPKLPISCTGKGKGIGKKSKSRVDIIQEKPIEKNCIRKDVSILNNEDTAKKTCLETYLDERTGQIVEMKGASDTANNLKHVIKDITNTTFSERYKLAKDIILIRTNKLNKHCNYVGNSNRPNSYKNNINDENKPANVKILTNLCVTSGVTNMQNRGIANEPILHTVKSIDLRNGNTNEKDVNNEKKFNLCTTPNAIHVIKKKNKHKWEREEDETDVSEEMSLRDSSGSEISDIPDAYEDEESFVKNNQTTQEPEEQTVKSEDSTSLNTLTLLSLTDIKENQFILVKFQVGKSNKYYVGKVINVDRVSLSVKFMRKKCNNIYYWPVVDDISIVFIQDVVMILKHSESRRGLIKIDDKIDLYQVS